MNPVTGGDGRIFPWLTLASVGLPPDPTVTMEEKDRSETYDNYWCRFHASKVNNTYINWFRIQYQVNSNFARGAWGIEEDRLTFLRDGQKDTSRKELSLPIIQPMVLRLSGQAAALSISAKATAVTQYAVTRKEEKMNRAVAMAIGAQQGSFVEGAVQANTGFDQDEFRSKAMADSTFQDKETHTANCLMTMQERTNNYEGIRNGYSPIVACSGMFAMHCRANGTELNWEFCNPYDIAWDTNTNKPDLSGEFVIHAPLMPLAEVARRYPLKKDQLQSLWKATVSQATATSGWPQGQPRVMTVYYRDPQWTTMGWVMNGERPQLVDAKEKLPNGQPKYQNSDFIDPPTEGEYGKYTKAWKGKTYSSFEEVIRYCTFIPYEYLPTSVKTQNSDNGWKDGKTLDIILEKGVCELQDTNPEHPRRTGFPIKLSTTQYINGFVIAPITAAIAPQRVANLVTSDLVWRMEKAGNMSPVFDKRALAASQMTLEEIKYAQKEGDPIELDGAVAGGLNNAISRSDASLPASFYQMWNVPSMLSQYAQMGTGIQDATMGKAENGQQLVGTTQLLLQQSNTMMQPFVNCYLQGFRQVHQFDVQAGKKFYKQYPWAFADMVGDMGLETVMASDSMDLEQFRADIEMSMNSTALKAATDEMILKFVELGLLDGASAAELGGQSYPEDVWNGAKTFSRQAKEAQAQAAEAAAKQQQMQAIAQQSQLLQERQDQEYANAYKMVGDQMAHQQKLQQPAAQRMAEASIPVPSEQPEPAAATPGT